MKDGFIRAVCATPSLRVADCRYNVSQMIEAIRAAAKSKAKLLVFPELSVTGYTCGDLFGQKVLLDGAEEGLSRLLKASVGLDLIVLAGLPVPSGGKLYNCAAIFQNGVLLGVIPKSNLPAYGEFYEPGATLPRLLRASARPFSAGRPLRSAPICSSPAPSFPILCWRRRSARTSGCPLRPRCGMPLRRDGYCKPFGKR